jgi:hypothetical protein
MNLSGNKTPHSHYQSKAYVQSVEMQVQQGSSYLEDTNNSVSEANEETGYVFDIWTLIPSAGSDLSLHSASRSALEPSGHLELSPRG